MTLRLCFADGATADGHNWGASVDPVDRRVLDAVREPVLDVGCGPARHTIALSERGLVVMGIDITPPALERARRSGAAVLERSVFEHLPGAGRWASALLLDGNIGIGGDAVTLLRRLRELLAPDGRIIAELDADAAQAITAARLEVEGRTGPWFAWRPVGPAEIAEVASASAMRITSRWSDTGRHFCVLERW
jgi:SAM-dependent methyltransferase